MVVTAVHAHGIRQGPRELSHLEARCHSIEGVAHGGSCLAATEELSSIRVLRFFIEGRAVREALDGN